MDLQWWMNNGVSVAMLAAVGVGCFYAGKWVGREFLRPIKDRILKFFDTLETALVKMGEHDTKTTDTLDRIRELISAVREDQRSISETCLRTEEHLETLGLRRRQRRRPRPPSDPMRPPPP